MTITVRKVIQYRAGEIESRVEFQAIVEEESPLQKINIGEGIKTEDITHDDSLPDGFIVTEQGVITNVSFPMIEMVIDRVFQCREDGSRADQD